VAFGTGGADRRRSRAHVSKASPKDPSAIPHEAVPYLKLPPETKSVSVELTYRDGSVSEIKSFRR
jgi:hypothetical protein